ncbi:SIR2 family NAD-dependent protein deacylase [Salinispora tropica]|uniref:NAD-dependent protein deacylase n=1 Tax=Salinispora tropica (strain ATCC BAA-916 / DSM 44818 / JCM 13857 / NBRC 105044 / CNB-440) TaxID=369723 RepID=A4X8W0_SALTO|nr:NAD-dependent deacylase [Salinispora tropica]ABP55310.1 Silent information regulator protein Sir2 [Salinispora tropica CNB-440]
MEEVLPHRVAQLLRDARRVVIFTGAGISAESGVPTFRDDLTGLWARFDAQQLATAEAFHADPDLVWGWYEWRRARVRRAEPNSGHLAITTIESRIPDSTVITQNVDDLHERAGTPATIHLHGSLFAPRCMAAAAHPATFPDQPDGEAAEPHEGRRISPPRCASCRELVRPGVVWFGEALPEAALTAAAEAATACDVLLTVGTSGVVYPAAEIPRIAASSGATVIQVNPQPTPLDRIAAINLRGSAAQVLPTLVAAAWR